MINKGPLYNRLGDLLRNPVKLSYGLGVDSTAIIVEMVRRQEPIDAITFADTASEKPETYAYLPIINAFLVAHGYPEVTVVKNASPIAGDKSLLDECLRKSVLPSLAYGGHSCSLKWKVEPQRKWMKAWKPWRDVTAPWARGDFKVENLIGYDCSPADLKRRGKVHGRDGDKGVVNRYPLQEWGWDRERCKQAILEAGLPLPPKSACFFCPASKKPEIAELKTTHPTLFALCLELERKAHERGLTTVKGLGRRFAWSDVT